MRFGGLGRDIEHVRAYLFRATFDIGADDTVTGIGSGRLDCTACAN